MSLDFPTFGLVGFLVYLSIAIGFSLILLVLRGHPVLRLWTASLWCGALGLQPWMPTLLSILLRNVLMEASSVLLLRGLARHLGLRPPLRPALLLVVAYMTAIGRFSLVMPDLPIRLRLFSVVCVLWDGWAIWLLLRHAPRDIRASCRLAAGVFALDALLYAVRALFPVAADAHGDILRAGWPINLTDIGGTLLVMAQCFALLLLLVERQMTELRRLARRDGLTGLFNRTALLGDGELALEQCARRQQPFAAMRLDLDHFKQVNDTWGHQSGDDVLLRHTADVLRRVAQGRDCLLGRYGGEEFVLLLPGAGLDGAGAGRAAAHRAGGPGSRHRGGPGADDHQHRRGRCQARPGVPAGAGRCGAVPGQGQRSQPRGLRPGGDVCKGRLTTYGAGPYRL